jgi:UDP-GlcNAc:undecaprenyl-phosphate GlcNAc-1-phosphate transferase
MCSVDISDFGNMILLSLARYVLILIISYALTAFSFPYLYRFMVEGELVKLNFREERIPAVAGLVFLILLPLTTCMGMFFKIESFSTINAVLFLWVVMGMGLIGFIDDAVGTHEYKGFKGHLRALLRENRLTTGGFKAIFGAVVAMIFSVATANLLSPQFSLWLIASSFFLVTLSANTINLFDLRPGRAGKVFIFGFVLILCLSKDFEKFAGLFIPILAIMLYYLPFDLKARVMMGDVGSNLLGASLGVMMAWMLSDLAKIIAICLLIVFHLAAEKISFSKVIEGNRLLRSLDKLGRRNN